ncbi:pirin family protein [Paenibacillus piri]|uniref:pirin family protein n=1 Tax=Paenibacillus piri TaxID=2547395 RepID=UPI001C6FDC61
MSGKAEHGDSLGTRSVVGPGGAQVMQTGSGVSHEEGFVGPNILSRKPGCGTLP